MFIKPRTAFVGIAVVALIGLVVFLMSDTGVMSNAFQKITGQFVDKSESLISDVGSIGDGTGGSGESGGSGSGSELPDAGVNTETGEITDTWEQIQQAIEEGVYATRYATGNYKSITIDGYGDVVMEIVAFNADTKADGSTAAISWVSRGIITTHVMNSTSTNANGWEASEMRSWLQSEVYNALPADVKAAIVSVNKTYYDKTTGETKTCTDKVWIPSAGEIFGNSNDTDGCEASGADYTAYFNSTSARIKYNSSGTAAIWWLRSANSHGSNAFRSVNGSGTIRNNIANTTYGVVLGFCM